MSRLFPDSVRRLLEELQKLPTIGPKSAQRLMLHLLEAPLEDVRALSVAITDMRDKVIPCPVCGNLSEIGPCAICLDASRDLSQICVVEEPIDLIAIERAHDFGGVYHVLGGRISPLDGILPEDLSVDSLIERIQDSDAGIREIILATNTDVEGDATAGYLSDLLHGKFPGLSVTRIATGLPIGAELDYADQVTLIKALQGRRKV
ncbi:MAG: recombination mediator RecR [bacterium]|nr:recombination mediator RecR [bacterium]